MSLFRRNAAPKLPEEFSFAEAMEKVREKREAAEACGYDTAKLHCRGCINSCPLSRARCDVGRLVSAALEKKKEE